MNRRAFFANNIPTTCSRLPNFFLVFCLRASEGNLSRKLPLTARGLREPSPPPDSFLLRHHCISEKEHKSNAVVVYDGVLFRRLCRVPFETTTRTDPMDGTDCSLEGWEMSVQVAPHSSRTDMVCVSLTARRGRCEWKSLGPIIYGLYRAL